MFVRNCHSNDPWDMQNPGPNLIHLQQLQTRPCRSDSRAWQIAGRQRVPSAFVPGRLGVWCSGLINLMQWESQVWVLLAIQTPEDFKPIDSQRGGQWIVYLHLCNEIHKLTWVYISIKGYNVYYIHRYSEDIGSVPKYLSVNKCLYSIQYHQ